MVLLLKGSDFWETICSAEAVRAHEYDLREDFFDGAGEVMLDG